MKKHTKEAIFCAKYLKENGYLSGDKLDELSALIDDLDVDFNLVRIRKDYYTELAEKLRELWPSGNKDGKYPWRDSVKNLAYRLKYIWALRGLKEYTVDDVLSVARKYLAQYENDATYMQTLPYFICKQKRATIDADGKIDYETKSVLADMLESLTDEQRQQNEFEALFGNTQFEQGTII